MSWRDHFTPAGPTGSNFTTDGDVAAEDIIAGRVLEFLLADPKLVEIFGVDAIEILETRAPFDFRDFPRLQVYTSSTSETQSPTQVDVNLVVIYINVRFDALNVEVLKPYEASLATVRKYVATKLKAIKSLKVQINGTTDVPLAMEMRTVGTNWIWDPAPQGDRIAGNLEMEFTWRVDVDHFTQRIGNLKNAIP